MYIIDEYSDDGSTEIAKANEKAVVIQMNTDGINDDIFCKLFDEGPKQLSNGVADYVVCVDIDELLYGDVSKMEGDLLVPEGWQMISEKLPTTEGQIYEEVTEGVPDLMMSKPIVRRPHIDIHYAHGRHSCQSYTIQTAAPYLKLLHFRFLSPEYVQSRHNKNWPRIAKCGKDIGSGIHTKPGWDGYQSMKWYQDALKEKKPCLGGS
jgi:hypothetical protein